MVVNYPPLNGVGFLKPFFMRAIDFYSECFVAQDLVMEQVATNVQMFVAKESTDKIQDIVKNEIQNKILIYFNVFAEKI